MDSEKRHKLTMEILWIAAAAVTVLLAVLVSFWTAVVFALFAVAFLLDVNPVIPFAVALVLLLICPLMILIDQKTVVDVLANWSYCFLSIGVLTQLYQYLKSAPVEGGEAGGIEERE